MTVSDALLLVEPAFRSAPEYTETLGPEVGDLADLAGFAPDPEQQLGLDLLFAMNRQGKSAAFEFAVICARQNLKTGFFKQAALGWLFLTDQQLIVWSAHEFRTAQEAFRDMENMIGGSPWLSKRVKKVSYAAGSEGIELRSGQRLIFKARTSSGGRGLTGDKVVLDEAFALTPAHMGALLPTLAVRPDPQVVYGSSAGLMQSEVLRGIRDRGRKASSPRLAYVEWCAPRRGCEDEKCTHLPGSSGCQLDDLENWQRANPLLGRTRSNGTGLTVEYVTSEREAMPPEEFARERLGWWDEAGSIEAFPSGKWDLGERDERPDGLMLSGLAIAMSYDLSRVSVAGAGRLEDETWAKVLLHGPDTDDAVDKCSEWQRTHGADVVIDGRGPAAVLIPTLEKAGVRLRIADTSDVLDSCAGIDSLVRDEQFFYTSAPELEAAVAGAVRRIVGDRWAWGRAKSTSDISPLEAVTFATWATNDHGPPVPDYLARGVLSI